MAAPRKPNRRDFLRGRPAVEAVVETTARVLPTDRPGDLPPHTQLPPKLPPAVGPARANPATPEVLAAGEPLAATPDDPILGSQNLNASHHRPQTYLIRVGRRAMACEFEVLLNAGQYADGIELSVAALDLVERLEGQLTVYRESSELSLLNVRAGERAIRVEPRLFELLSLAKQIYDKTAGAYDITSGPLTKAWGFFRRAGRVPTASELDSARSIVGSDKLLLDPEAQTVRFQSPGMEINLGSIGKGYALDRVAEQLESSGVGDFMLHGGKSSLLARGSRSAVGDDGWWIGVVDPLRPTRRLGEVLGENRALATSGSGTQFFYHEGRRYGHLLDPRSGQPAVGMLSATVLARTAAEADALSTAFYVMGPEAALDFCARHEASHPGLAAILISPGAAVGSATISTYGLAERDWRLAEPSAG